MDRLMEQMGMTRTCSTPTAKSERRSSSSNNPYAAIVHRLNSAARLPCPSIVWDDCLNRRPADGASFAVPLRRTRDQLSVSALDLFRRATGTWTSARDRRLYAETMARMERDAAWQFAKRWAGTGAPQRVVPLDRADAFLCDVGALLGHTAERDRVDAYRRGPDFARLFDANSTVATIGGVVRLLDSEHRPGLCPSGQNSAVTFEPLAHVSSGDVRAVNATVVDVPSAESCAYATPSTPQIHATAPMPHSPADTNNNQEGPGHRSALHATDVWPACGDDDGGKQRETGQRLGMGHQGTHPDDASANSGLGDLSARLSCAPILVGDAEQAGETIANTTGQTDGAHRVDDRGQVPPCDVGSTCPPMLQFNLLSSVPVERADTVQSAPTVPRFELDLNDPPPPDLAMRDDHTPTNSSSLVDRTKSTARDVSDWTAVDVGDWVAACDGGRLAQYRDAFIENCITGPDLLDLARMDISCLGQMGIIPMGHRLALLRGISQLGVRTTQSPMASAPPPLAVDGVARWVAIESFGKVDACTTDASLPGAPAVEEPCRLRPTTTATRPGRCVYKNCRQSAVPGITRCQKHRERQNEYTRRSHDRQKRNQRSPLAEAATAAHQHKRRRTDDRARGPARALQPIKPTDFPEAESNDDCRAAPNVPPDDTGASPAYATVDTSKGRRRSSDRLIDAAKDAGAVASNGSAWGDAGPAVDTVDRSENAGQNGPKKRRRNVQGETDDEATETEDEYPAHCQDGSRSPIEVDYPPMTLADLLALYPESQCQTRRRMIDCDDEAVHEWHVHHNTQTLDAQ